MRYGDVVTWKSRPDTRWMVVKVINYNSTMMTVTVAVQVLCGWPPAKPPGLHYFSPDALEVVDDTRS